MVSDVCRLCLTKDNLVWIFDKRFESSENMKDVIYITTGVEITIKDIVSQKICKKCCEVTIKMFEFRRTSLANDRHLREQSLINLKESIKIPHTDVTIRPDSKIAIKSEIKKEQTQDSLVFKVHPTVRALFKIHPQIKLPTVCLKSHIAPFVSLKMDQVENYFKARKLDMNTYTRLALRSGKVATKKTAAPVIPKAYSCSSSDKLKNTATDSNGSLNKHKISPIKIVYNKPHCDSAVVSKVDDTNITKDSPKSIEMTTPRRLHQDNNKRKFHEIETTPKKENFKKPNFIESLGLTPTVNAHSSNSTSDSPAYVANMSVPLHICDMCNSVQYSAKDLKKHQHKHLRCQFCKMRFRTLDSKNRHIEDTCVIKQTMNNLPDVELSKIEYDVEVRGKYPKAFVDFAPLKNTINCLDNVDEQLPSSTQSNKEDSKTLNDCNSLQQSSKPIQESSVVDPVVIEILSDDDEEELSRSASGINKENIVNNNVLKNSVTGSSVSDAVKDKADVSQDVSTKPTAPTITVIEDNVVYNTVSIVKPDIRIRGNCVLDRLDPKLSDTKILKELLSSKHLQLNDDKFVQTDLPTNDSISINRMDSTTELKRLKQQLYVYKIPVVIKFGPLNVSYNYQMELKQPKKLCLWNDLMPIDIKTNKSVLKSSTPIIMNELTINKNSALQSCSVPKPPIAVPGTSLSNIQPMCPVATLSSSFPMVSSVPAMSLSNIQPMCSASTSTSSFPTVPSIPATNLSNIQPTCSVPTSSSSFPTVCSVPATNLSNIQPMCSAATSNSSLPTACSIPRPNITSPKFIRINKSSLINSSNIIDMNPLLSKFLHPTTTTSTITPTITTISSIPAPTLTSTSTTTATPVSTSNVTLGSIRVKNVWELT